MAEPLFGDFDPNEITAALRRNLEGYDPVTEMAQVGRIDEVGDGIARVSGLPGAAVNELLEFEGGTLGLALNLDEDSIGAVVLGELRGQVAVLAVDAAERVVKANLDSEANRRLVEEYISGLSSVGNGGGRV